MKYLALIALGLIPSLSFAATYFYVDTSGKVSAVEAPNAETAIAIAPDRAIHSGVALDMGYLEEGTDVNAFGYSNDTEGNELYHFVNSLGITDSVIAPDAHTALEIAPNIHVHSGVAVDRGIIEDGEVVPSVVNN